MRRIVPCARRQPPHRGNHSHEGSPRPQDSKQSKANNKQTFVNWFRSFFTMLSKIKNTFMFGFGLFYLSHYQTFRNCNKFVT